MNLTRVWSIVLRHIYNTLHQLERFTDVFVFPVMGVVLWGFLTQYSGQYVTGLASFLLGGLILWIVFEKVGTSIGVDFMFDVWDRSIVNILASPIKLTELVTGLVFVSIVKALVSLAAMWFLAGLLFGFNIGSLGVSLVLLWINVVIFAMSLGIFNISIITRYGASIGPLTWILPFILQPFVAVFYPLSILPQFVQKISLMIPITHVFEGMRFTLRTGQFATQDFVAAVLLNILYFAASAGFFAFMFNLAKRRGTLVKL